MGEMAGVGDAGVIKKWLMSANQVEKGGIEGRYVTKARRFIDDQGYLVEEIKLRNHPQSFHS